MECWCYAPAPMQTRGRCMHNNYIAGEWLASKEAIENRNPSNIFDLVAGIMDVPETSS